MTIANKNIMFGQSERLPYDAKVEYLDVRPSTTSDSIIGIDSGYFPPEVPGDSIFFKFSCLNNAGVTWPGNFSNYVNEQTRVTRCIYYSNQYKQVYAGWQRIASGQNPIMLSNDNSPGSVVEGRISSDSTYKINGITGSLLTPSGNSNPYPILFYVVFNKGVNPYFRWRTWYWRIESNGIVLHDYRFVRMKSGAYRVFDFAVNDFAILNNGEYDIPSDGIVSAGPDVTVGGQT